MPPKLPKLSPKEKKQIERRIQNIQTFSKNKPLSNTNRNIRRQQLKVVLLMLGARNPDIYLLADSLDIINDWKPFKIRRLRKLIYGRRRQ